MPPLPRARRGRKLSILQAPVEFSYFPTYQGSRRVGMHTKVYASDAWVLIKAAIRQDATNPKHQEARAFADQAEEFYRAAANAKTPHGRPLLLYYAFMNLVKALCLHRRNAAVLGKVGHGLADNGNHFIELEQAIVDGYPSGAKPQVFDEFLRSALSAGLVVNQSYRIRDILACSLIGHRLWTEAAESVDRFLKVTRITIMANYSAKKLWLRASIAKSSLSRHGFTQAAVTSGGFGAGWQAVRVGSNQPHDIITWEQTTAVRYTHRPSDSLEKVVADARKVFYRSLTTSEPFRNYYVYVPPSIQPGGSPFVKHDQLASRYILLFFLGSVTRYHPADFEKYLNGKFGPFLAEFLASEPSQMLFELACLFLKREIVTVGLT